MGLSLSWVKMVHRSLVFLSLKINFVIANCEDLDGGPHSLAFLQGPHSLQKHSLRGFQSTKDHEIYGLLLTVTVKPIQSIHKKIVFCHIFPAEVIYEQAGQGLSVV